MRPIVLSFLLMPFSAFAQLSSGSKLTGPEADAVRRDLSEDRAETRAWLKSDPSSYLAAISREDFGSKQVLAAGAAEGNEVRLNDPTIRPRHLRVTVQGEKFKIEAVDPDANFSVGSSTGGKPIREATVGPSAVRLGRYVLRLSHQGYPAIIVFDPKSPRFKEYHGIKYFPVDLSYRFVVKMIPDAAAATVAIKSSHSADRRAIRVGWFDFMVGKKPQRLAAYRLLEPGADADSLSVFFRDATTGKQSYGVGRYVEPKKQEDGSYVLDFNSAYNPACAFSHHYNCPIPPEENRLKVAIKAGEQDSHYH